MPGGIITAGSSSQVSDGAAAVLLVSEKILKQFNLVPLARFCSFAVAGVPPEIMGIGPVAAIPKALKLAGIAAPALFAGSFGYFIGPHAPVHLPGIAFLIAAALLASAVLVAWRYARPGPIVEHAIVR